MENANESKNADNDIKNVDQSSDEDEESFQLYVKTNFPEIFKKFKTENTIKCYYCNFVPRSRKLRDLENEMMTHIEDTHKDVIDRLEKDTFDDEYHEDFLGMFTE